MRLKSWSNYDVSYRSAMRTSAAVEETPSLAYSRLSELAAVL